jgi:hypothetical protein
MLPHGIWVSHVGVAEEQVGDDSLDPTKDVGAGAEERTTTASSPSRTDRSSRLALIGQ